ncbi:MAG: hypothetical protein LQ349_005970, partial [Xanthoria aureola]
HKIAASNPSAGPPEEEESRRKSRNGTDPSRLATSHFQYKPPHLKSPYNTPTSPAAHPLRVLAWLSRTPTPSSSTTSSSTKPPNQPLTSTARCAEIIWQLGHCAYPPLRLLLGAFAVESMRDRLRCVIEEIEEWRWLGFDDGEEVEEESRDAIIKGGGEDGDGDGDGDEDGAEEMGEEGPGEGEGMEDEDAAEEGADKDEGMVEPESRSTNK